ncbi:MAG: hypothetical protein KDD50_12120 [Bdellovibrionales bacterium]|nr:hypothetical protein [Bdellovibrionales bacterium]
MKHLFCIIFGVLCLFVSAQKIWAQENINGLEDKKYRPFVSDQFQHKEGPFYGFLPYLPRQREYNVELGGMWEDNTMYWAGMNVGFHGGKCFFLEEKSCQRYWDIVAGVGGREGNTNGLILGGMRWQFVNYPSTQSQSLKLLAGVMNIFDDQRQKSSFAYGIGYGIHRSVHENLDLKLELRLGGGDKLWGQVFFSAGLKLGSLVSYFANSIKDLGVGTVKTTGKILKTTVKTTVETTGKAVKAVGKGGQKVLEATHLKSGEKPKTDDNKDESQNEKTGQTESGPKEETN